MSSPSDRTTDPSADEVGSLGEEAVRLWAALGAWAGERADEAEEVVSRLADGARGDHPSSHDATGGLEHTACPLCRAMGAVRRLDPAVLDHLADAGASLLQAVSALMATSVPKQEPPAGDADPAGAHEASGA